MTVKMTADVWCDGDGCCQWTEGASGADKIGARQNAGHAGWTTNVLDGKSKQFDLCPDCSKHNRKFTGPGYLEQTGYIGP